MKEILLTFITSIYDLKEEELLRLKEYSRELNSIPWIEFKILSDNPNKNDYFKKILGNDFVLSNVNEGKFKRISNFINSNLVNGKWIQVFDPDDKLELDFLTNELKNTLSEIEEEYIIKHRYTVDDGKVITPRSNVNGSYSLLLPTKYMKKIPGNLKRVDVWDDILFVSALYQQGCTRKLVKEIPPYYHYFRNQGESTLNKHSSKEEVDQYISNLEKAVFVWKQINNNHEYKNWLQPYPLMFEKQQLKKTDFFTKEVKTDLKKLKKELKIYN